MPNESDSVFRIASFVLLIGILTGACSTSESTRASSSEATRASMEPAPIPKGSSSDPVWEASVPLVGNLVPSAEPRFDVGRLDPATPLVGVSLLFQRSDEQTARAHAVLRELTDPTSPRYHHWWKPSEIATAFGAPPEDLAEATAWLTSEGFTVNGPSPTATRLLFSGTAGQVESAFATELHRYVVRGKPHFALAKVPRVPAPLARFVGGLRGVHDFQLRPALHGIGPRPTPLFLEDAGGGAETLTLAPADFGAIYDLASLSAAGITGLGQSIAVVGASEYNDADITAFRTTFGLDPSIAPVRELVPLSGSAVVAPGFFDETELDLEWSGAVAKQASIHYVYTGNNRGYGPFDAIVWAIEQGTSPIITSSYGECEASLTPSEDIYLEALGDAASMEGVTLLNAAGDWGAASCDSELDATETAASLGMWPRWPASIPSVVAVGGTMLNWGDPIPEAPITPAIASAAPFDAYWSCTFSGTAACSPLTPPGYVAESAWNELAFNVSTMNYFWGAGGGGTSTLFTKPYWQVGQTPSGTMRLLPDVSVTGGWQQVGYVISQSWTAADGSEEPLQPEALGISGGTSAATPSFAGILALVNQALLAKNPTVPVGLGNANPLLYAINASTKGTAAPAFHDITTGNTLVPCTAGTLDCPATPPYQYGFDAGPGYDLATGIGSVDVANLVAAWTTLTPTRVTLVAKPSGTTEGSKVTLSATVSSTATTTAMTGSVVFYADTVDEAGLADLSIADTAALAPTKTGGHEGGTATASVIVPPGLLETAHVVAFYGGDAHYLASWSSASSVTAKSDFAIDPTATTVHPNGQATFTTSGGVAPVSWSIVRDTTYKGKTRARVEALSATTGIVQAGPLDGTTIVAAIDRDGAEVRATITASGAAVDGGTLPPPWDGGLDAASDATSHDASVDAPERSDAKVLGEPPLEAGREMDAATDEGASGAGCSCRSAGARGCESPLAASGLLLVGLLCVSRLRCRSAPQVVHARSTRARAIGGLA
jgi:Pro-kumamolisin, activation domain